MEIKQKNEFRALLVYPNLPLMLVPPLAMAIFTRILRSQGYQVELFDTTAYLSDESTSPQNRVKYLQARGFNENDDLGIVTRWDMAGDFQKKIEEFQPDVLLFSVVEDTVSKTSILLNAASRYELPSLLGGVFPTAAPEKCLDLDFVTAVAVGEGERTIVDFCEAIREKKSLSEVLGIWFKNLNGESVHNLPQELVDINDSLPDFSLFDPQRFVRPMGGKVFKTFPIETYRGCPYACTFCNSPMQREISTNNGTGNFLRRKKIPKLFEELKEIRDRYDPEFFYFVDDSFLARPRKEIEEFCFMYDAIGLPFWFNTRPENCSREALELIRNSGCYRISFGVECGNEVFRRKVLKRYVSNEQIVESFETIADSGIPFSINLIIGMPGETRALIFDTVELIKQIRGFDTVTVSIFTPYEGTVLKAVAEKNGWLAGDVKTVHTTSGSILEMPEPYLSNREIEGLMNTLPLYIYFPKSEWRNLQRAEQDDEEGIELRERYTKRYREDFLKISQDDAKLYVPETGSGCKSNKLDSYEFVPVQLSEDELSLLTMNG